MIEENPTSNTSEKTPKKGLETAYYLLGIIGAIAALLVTMKSCWTNEKGGTTIVNIQNSNIQNNSSGSNEDRTVLNSNSQHAKASLLEAEMNSINVSDMINPSDEICDVAILIVGENKKANREVTSLIADKYHNAGKSTMLSLFSSSFIQSPFFEKVEAANAKAIHLLELSKYAKHILIGTYSRTTEEPKYGFKYKYRVSLKLTLISCTTITQLGTIDEEGYGPSEDTERLAEKDAQENAIGKIENKYFEL